MNRTHKCRQCGAISGIFELCKECYEVKKEAIEKKEEKDIIQLGIKSDSVKPQYSCRIAVFENKYPVAKDNLIYTTTQEKLNLFDEVAFATLATLSKKYGYNLNDKDFVLYVARISNQLVSTHYDILRHKRKI